MFPTQEFLPLDAVRPAGQRLSANHQVSREAADYDLFSPSSSIRSNSDHRLQQPRGFLEQLALAATEGVTTQKPTRNGIPEDPQAPLVFVPQPALPQLLPPMQPTALQYWLMNYQFQQQKVMRAQQWQQQLDTLKLLVPPVSHHRGDFSTASMQPAVAPSATPTATVTQPTPMQQPRPAAAAAASALPPRPQKPKHSKTAYNYFFKDERARIIASEERGVGFAGMATRVGAKWKVVDQESKSKYEAMAAQDKERYYTEKAVYLQAARDEQDQIQRQLESTVDDETRKRYLESSGFKLTVSRKRSKK
jgi:hypothetical protein